MKYWTWLEMREKIERDLDLQEETFIEADELLGYANEAIDEAESEIHTLYEDYFLSRTTLTLVSAQESYDLPTDIYANKIRGIVYNKDTEVTPITRLREQYKFENYALNKWITDATGVYEYLLDNSTAGSPKIILSPAPLESGPYVTIWYLRNANRLTDGSSICDIPEFVTFVIQFIKMRCYEKEGHPNLEKSIADLEALRAKMNGTLAAMVSDNNNKIEADYSFYEEME